MLQAVRKIEEARDEEPCVVHELATIVEIHEGTVLLESRGRTREAKIAAACLLAPSEGDRVLVVEAGAEAYVLAVLERGADTPARLHFEGDLDLSVGGRLRVTATEGVELATSKALSFVSSVMKMRAKDSELAIDRLVMIGREAVVSTVAAKLVTGALDSFVERLQQHVKRSYRTVEEMDQLRAKRLDYRTEEELSMRGKHAFVHAADLVKVTGAQIHMG